MAKIRSSTINREILLESGSNEVEIIEFYLGGQSFGVNVAKVRQIIQFDRKTLTRTPDSGDAVLGVILARGETITLMDMNALLKRPPIEDDARRKDLVLITEFSGNVTGFLIHGVNRIHRLSWEDIQPMNYFPGNYGVSFTGSINVDDNEILLVDLERVLSTIDPDNYGIETAEDLEEELSEEPEREPKIKKRENAHIVFAEDSGYIRELFVDNIRKVGYKNLVAFENGKLALDYLEELKAKSADESVLDLVVTDIEMPKMDGLTLCKNIKDRLFPNVPVLIFSSLVNEQMAAKCREVKADNFVNKPKFTDLVRLVDQYALGVTAST